MEPSHSIRAHGDLPAAFDTPAPFERATPVSLTARLRGRQVRKGIGANVAVPSQPRQ
jgi:hypothetical protein